MSEQATGTLEPPATGDESVALTEDNLRNMFEQGAFNPGAKSESESEDPPGDAEPAPEEEQAEQAEEEQSPDEGAEEGQQEPATDRIDDFLADLDDEQKKDLAVKLGGRLGKDLGKLRAEVRELKASGEIDAAKREPFQRKQTENPYAKEADLKSLEETYQSAEVVLKDGEKLLRRNRNADPDDEIVFGEHTITISQLEDMVDTAREAHDTHIPERARQLRESEGMEAARLHNFEEVKRIHPWLDEEGELRSAFESVRDQYLPSVRDHMPTILPYFDTMIADHLDACRQRAATPAKKAAPAKAAKKQTQQKPPGSPGGSAAASGRPVPSEAKRNKMIEQFTTSGRSMTEGDLAQFLLNK